MVRRMTYFTRCAGVGLRALALSRDAQLGTFNETIR